MHVSDAASDTDYACPHCLDTVRLRCEQSTRKRRHLFHLTAECDRDQRTHTTGIRLVEEVVRDWASGAGPSPAVMKACSECQQFVRLELQPKIRDAIAERSLSDLARVPDVTLVDDVNAPVLLVEVYHTHEVSPRKADDYASCGYTWIEVVAEEIIAARLEWRSRAHGPTFVCDACRLRKEREAEATRQALERMRMLRQLRAEEAEKDREAQTRLEAARKRRLEWYQRDHGPLLRQWITKHFPRYRVSKILDCPDCNAFTPFLSWGTYTPPEPRPPWLEIEGRRRMTCCRGCGRYLKGHPFPVRKTTGRKRSFWSSRSR